MRIKSTWFLTSWLLMLLAGAAVRGWQIDEPLWVDELHTAWSVGDALAEVAPRAMLGNQGPLYFWLSWVVVQVAGLNEPALRLLSVLAGTLLPVATGWLTFTWTRSHVAGFVAAVLVLLDPMCIFYSQEARPYALLQLIGVGHLWLTWRLDQRPSAQLACVWVLGGLAAFHLHYTAALFVAAESTWLWARAVRQLDPLRLGINLASTTAVLVGWSAAASHLIWIAGRRADWQAFVDEATWGGLFGLLPLHVYVLPSLVAVAVVWSVARAGGISTIRNEPRGVDNPRPAGRQADERGAWSLAICWCALPLVLAWLATYWYVAPLFFVRYLVLSWIAPIVLAAMLLTWLEPHKLRRIAAGLVIALVLAMSPLPQNLMQHGRFIPDRQENWPAAVQAINADAERRAYPVAVFAGLIEAAAFVDSGLPRQREYCLLPVLGPYRVNRSGDELMALADASTNSLQSADLEQIEAGGGLWLLVRARPPDANTFVQTFGHRLEDRGLQFSHVEVWHFGHVTLAVLE